MKIALVSNWQTHACGVANFGRDWAAALERAGYTVLRLLYDDLMRVADADAFVCYNWHPATTPLWTQDPADEPRRRPFLPYAVYLHDIPPHSICSLVHGATAVWAAEPTPGARVLPYPVYDGPLAPIPTGSPAPVTIGWTGLRGDGRDALQALCDRRGWVFNGSTDWLDTPEEVARLAASTLIVLWYFADGRGQSLALSTACATGRPILVNESRMFGLARRYPTAIYRAGFHPAVPFMEQAIEAVLGDSATDHALLPHDVATQHSWRAAITQMEAAWSPR